MKKEFKWSHVSLAAMTAVSVAVSGCAKKDSTSDSTSASTPPPTVAKLSQLPAAGGVVKSNAKSYAAAVLRGETASAVSGTPPKISDLRATPSSIDTAFYNGLAATLSTATPSAITSEQRDQFWGNTVGGPGGDSACRMAQTVENSFDLLAQFGTSACYMKSVSSAANGITVTSGSITVADLFQKEAADKIYEVSIAEGSNSQIMHIKVFGGVNGYKAQLANCSGSTAKTGEKIDYDADAGKITFTTLINDSWGYGNAVLAGFLKDDGAGGIAYDTSKDRTLAIGMAQSSNDGSMGMKMDLTVNADNQILMKMLYDFSGSGFSGRFGLHSVSEFEGDSAKSVKFRAAGAKMVGTNTYNGATDTYTGSTAVEFQDTFYKRVADDASTLYASVKSSDLTAGFWADATVTNPSADIASGYDSICAATPDYKIAVDMASAAMLEIQKKCEGERLKSEGNSTDMCETDAIKAARNNIFTSY